MLLNIIPEVLMYLIYLLYIILLASPQANLAHDVNSDVHNSSLNRANEIKF